MNLANWLDYIETLHPRNIELGLQRIQLLADRHFSFFTCPVITVTGTNGKGSVVRILESIYLAAGYRVAAYTSPHILTFNERLRINGESVSDAALLEAFEWVEKIREGIKLTYFEFTTLSALFIFQRLPLDVLLLEVGLGGRLDAVNIISPDVAVITTIDIDHTDWLGNDRESIGFEKAGIMRHQKPVVFGDTSVPFSILNAASALEAPLYQQNHHFSVEEMPAVWHWHGPKQSYENLPYPALKLQNAATSLMAVSLLYSERPVTDTAVRQGLQTAQLPGRFEALLPVPESKGTLACPIIFDVAHNPQATVYLAQQLKMRPISGQTRAVLSILQDKDARGMLHPLQSHIDQWYVAGLSVPRGQAAHPLASILRTMGEKNCYTFDSVNMALDHALREASPEDRILVFGSFYTVSIAKQHLQTWAG